MLPVFSVIDSIVVTRSIACPGRIGAWKVRSLPAHIRRGNGTGGMKPPSAACPSAPSSLIGTSSSEKCSQCPNGNKGAAWSPSWPSRVARRAARCPSAVSVAVALRPTQSWRFGESLIAVIFLLVVREIHPHCALAT